MAAKPKSKYRRCRNCKQLIMAYHDDCPNCAAEANPQATRTVPLDGKRKGANLDVMERNLEEYR